MSFLSQAARLLLPKAEQTIDMRTATPEQLEEFIRGWGGYQSAAGITVNESSALKVAAAWRCIHIISGVLSSMPFDLVERVGENERRPAVNHPMRQVLTVRPNPWQTPKEFKQMLQMHLLLRGNAFARKVKLGRNIVALIPIRPDRVTVEQLADGTLEYRVMRPDGQELKVKPADLIHFRGMTLDGVAGLSPLSFMREALGLSLQAEKAAARLYVNGSFISGLLKHPGKLSKEAFERLKTSWRNEAGLENSGETRILEEGMEFDRLSMTAADAQFLQSRDFQRYDIAMFFGVPPHMIGATDKQTSWGSGIEQQNIGFVQYTVNDWFVTWQETLKRDTLAENEWDRYDYRFYPHGLLKGDMKTQWDAFMKGLQWGVFSPDDVRAMLDLNPRPDGKGGDYYDPPNTAGGAKENTNDSQGSAGNSGVQEA